MAVAESCNPLTSIRGDCMNEALFAYTWGVVENNVPDRELSAVLDGLLQSVGPDGVGNKWASSNESCRVLLEALKANESPQGLPRSASPAEPKLRPAEATLATSVACQAIEPYTGDRRRLTCKQPPATNIPKDLEGAAIEVYTGFCNRRLSCKQPPRKKIPVSVRIVARGHYDRLGLRRDATQAEIRAAYRRQALGTHPDKGGDPHHFHEVNAAFEELADAARRAAYDRNLDYFGCRDGSLTERPLGAGLTPSGFLGQQQPRIVTAGPREYGEARVLQEKLIVSTPTAWTKLLAAAGDGTLEALKNILVAGNCEGSGETGFADPSVLSPWGDAADNSGRPRAAAKNRCIHRHKNGYTVQVSWASLSVNTSHTQSLAQAIDWQIALVSLQVEAQARLHKSRGLHDTVDITEEEWFKLLAAEPSIRPQLRFAFKAGGKRGKLIQTPGVESYRTAMTFMRRFTAMVKSRSSDVALDKAKTQANREAAKERKDRREGEVKLKKVVLQEVQRRSNLQLKGIEDLPGRALGGSSARKSNATPASASSGRKRKRDPSPSRLSLPAGEATPPKSVRGRKQATPPKVATTPPKPRKSLPKAASKAEEPPRKMAAKRAAGNSGNASLSRWFATSAAGA